ncbi:bifunctional diaminohydroxyphosphoribosylaminopyrimidine deaminase/5-amino-6-(5-phosphoribosylamino)uracil reductase RibD [Paenibacillus shenyangensis]|uniref:bifunctional diaminohydroxyphosphoribosylaminopyrimidine deaminase/5-amino-6-(5-phosphoribosylamino)uracil reductase RibD n=1 Tax=Paenibacillus sp. A9 TaxID=1284352 RepID=UPI000378BB54|nr:bifunctional diaminohydroxyphosphoribosylaminopyrimidine deaminase/5-amino-6-(5-phosphoribosylamino)uracil reductase RibD [Paenibacillus sp. A9]
MNILNDEFYMSLALDMAEKAQGQTDINPVVGCVVVKDGRIVGMGAHLRRGTGHAEVHALNMAGAEAEGATAYVTLEPCSHYGKTPPCSDRLIKEKVRRVVVAAVDPNPQVAGSGIERLRSHGIEVVTGVLADRSERLNETFNKYITTGLPFVTLKTASTLDGRLASRTGDSKWISNSDARERVHGMRHRHQGIMVGIGTVLADDPELTTRTATPGINPVRIVIDSHLRIPDQARLLNTDQADTIIVTTTQADPVRISQLENRGIRILRCGEGPQVDLTLAMRMLGEQEISSILLEGGGRLNGSMLEAGLVDRVTLFFAPKLIGGSMSTFTFDGFEKMNQAVTLEQVEVETLDDNVCISGRTRYHHL